ncbi:hypothetical protein BJX99DRAFT_258652 [Aspergillus californicus]
MVQLKSLFVVLLTAVTLPLEVSARDCYTNDTGDATDDDCLLVTHSEQLDAFSGCTKLIGHILVDPTFSGSFVLKGVEMVEGTIASVGDDEANVGDPLDALEFPDLQGLLGLTIRGNRTIRRLSFPRLQAIWMMDVVYPNSEWFDMGSLEYASMIALGGAWTNISFPSLQEAEMLRIDVDLYTSPDTPLAGSDRVPPMDIDLPALKKGNDISIRGSVNSFVWLEHTEGLTVDALYPDLSVVELPSLTSCDGDMNYTGYIKKIDLGPLEKTIYGLNIKTETPVEIMSSLQEAGSITISGPVKFLDFSDITSARNLDINITSQARCSPSLVTLYRQLNRPEEAELCDSESLQLAGPNIWADSSYIHPTSEPTPSSSPAALSNSDTPSPSPSPSYSPSPSPSPVPVPGSGVNTAGQVVILSLFAMVAVVAIARYFISPRTAKACEGGQTEKSSLVADIEKRGEKESDPLLESGFGDYDAPPAYAEHVQGKN